VPPPGPVHAQLCHENMSQERDRRFLKGLDPASALCEVTCGLVMTLTVLLTAGYYVTGSDDPARSLLAAALGCSLAWGIIDGLLYVMSDLYVRSQKNEFLQTLHAQPTEGRAVLLRRATGDLAALLTEAQIGQLVDALAQSGMRLQPERVRFTRENLSAMVTTVVSNMLAMVPAALPFILLPGNPWQTNLRISNFLVVAMIGGTGVAWGKTAGFRPLRTGAFLLVMGLTMVAIAVFLGG